MSMTWSRRRTSICRVRWWALSVTSPTGSTSHCSRRWCDSGLSLLMVGPRDPRWEPERFERLIASPHAQWVGLKPFEALPGYLRLIDVGITPYQDTAFNRASFPLKTLEYLAAGRGAVSSDLPATRWLQTDLVQVASGPAAFAAAVLDGGGAASYARADASPARGRGPALVARPGRSGRQGDGPAPGRVEPRRRAPSRNWLQEGALASLALRQPTDPDPSCQRLPLHTLPAFHSHDVYGPYMPQTEVYFLPNRLSM